MSTLSVTSGTQTIDLEVQDTGGGGRPVVLIHGWPLSLESWSEQVPALQGAGYRVVAYDRRGFGRSAKPDGGFDYDTLADDLHGLLEALDLQDVTLVGFSMGGGEVARYVTRHGQDRLHSVVFAAAIPPYLMQSDDNPDGPLGKVAAAAMQTGLRVSRSIFFPQFMKAFFTADGELKATEEQVEQSVGIAHQSDQGAAVGCMQAFAETDFRSDLPAITVPTLVLHGGSDATVPYEGSGQRTAAAVPGAKTVVVAGAPHGFNLTHAEQFNSALLDFLAA